MTRFQEALGFGMAMLALWAVVWWQVAACNNPTALLHAQLLPFYGVIMFGAVSAIIVLYRVFTFNNCSEANLELQKQIKQAKQDLAQKGFVFVNNKKSD